MYGVGRWGEREGDGFPLINCHSFPGYFVRKTCPGEKEFPEALPTQRLGRGNAFPPWSWSILALSSGFLSSPAAPAHLPWGPDCVVRRALPSTQPARPLAQISILSPDGSLASWTLQVSQVQLVQE